MADGGWRHISLHDDRGPVREQRPQKGVAQGGVSEQGLVPLVQGGSVTMHQCKLFEVATEVDDTE
eukprot:gene39008-63341_t